MTSGAEITGEKWSRLRIYGYRSSAPEPDDLRFLFTFGDVGATGFRRWMKLREKFRRGVDPWMATLVVGTSHIQTQIAESGMGFEAIGYQLALEAGCSRTKADNERHRQRLERVAAEIPEGLLPDLETWVVGSTDAYNSVKHANRDMPDLLELVNLMRRNIVVFRVWVATRIGVRRTVLERSLPRDRLTGDVSLW